MLEIKAMSKPLKSYQFRAMLLDDMRVGRLKPGAFIGTASQLSALHGLSLITVNRVLRSLAEQGVVERIRNRGTFVSEHYRPLKRLRFGLCFELPPRRSLEQYYYSSAFHVFPSCAKQYIKELGHSSCDFSFSQLSSLDFDRDVKIDALLLNAGVVDAHTMPALMQKKYPIAVVQQIDARMIPFHQVIPNLYEAALQSLQKAQAKGIEKLNFLCPQNETQRNRHAIFLRAAMQLGFTAERIRVFESDCLDGDFGQLAGYKLGVQALSGLQPGSLCVCYSDFVAHGVLSAFLEKRLEPGSDFQLISFDNLEAEGYSPFGKPMLSSIDFPKREVICRAIDLLIEKVSAEDLENVIVQIPCRLVERLTFQTARASAGKTDREHTRPEPACGLAIAQS